MKHDLNGFTGSEGYFFNPFFKPIKYTDGIKFLSDNKASWLVTDTQAVLLHEPSVKKCYEDEGFICVKWKFEKDSDEDIKSTTATATYTDGNEKILFIQKYQETDFLNHYDIKDNELNLYYTNGVLLLGSEY